MPNIKSINALEILDSRGNPTVEVEVTTSENVTGRFCVPSGASTGEFEAVELRDEDPKRFMGKGVTRAVENVKGVISDVLFGMSVLDQQGIDNKMLSLDGTGNKSNLGANAILGVSMATARAAALTTGKYFHDFVGSGNGTLLPVPLMNVINGGAHADNGLDIQEFMIVPYGQTCFSESLRCGVEIFHKLKEILKKRGLSISVGDEGGFAPKLASNVEGLSLLCEAIEKAGYRCGEDVGLALDVAASEFFDRSKNVYKLRDLGELASEDMVSYFKDLVSKFPIVSIEDPLDQNDWRGFHSLTRVMGNKVQIVGDDLFVTNVEKLKRGIEEEIANAVLVKLNQVGTLSETLATVNLAKKSNFGVIWSHRSGETEDTSIADLAVATNAGQIKTGSLSRTDRVAKYNQLLRIEAQLADRGEFAGRKIFKRGD